MIEEDIELRTADGTADGVLFRPEGRERCPAVLSLTDIGGLRPACRDMGRQLAEAGYVVLMPNLFYRTARPPILPFPLNLQDEATRTRMGELTSALSPDAVERDAAACVNFLAGHPAVREGSMGVVGYCYAGGVALRMAAARADRIAAAASFHGGRLCTDAPTSPHLLLPRIKARLYFGHARDDRTMPKEAILRLDEALSAWGGRYESETYPAYHSWTVTDSPVYDGAAAARAFGKLTELFAQALG